MNYAICFLKRIKTIKKYQEMSVLNESNNDEVIRF